MSQADRERWDAKYSQLDVSVPQPPEAWLVENLAGTPPGRVCELACGLGHNAIWLAQQGWSVTAIDISAGGIACARQLAESEGVTVDWIVADLDFWQPAAEFFDLVILFRFLDRVHVPTIVQRALRPGGILIYETFSEAHLRRPENHFKTADFTLRPSELAQMFPRLEVIRHEEAQLHDRSVGRLVARKPLKCELN